MVVAARIAAAPRTAAEKLAAAAEEDSSSKLGHMQLKTTHRITEFDNASNIVGLPGGKHICVADTGHHRLLILSTETGKVVSAFGLGGSRSILPPEESGGGSNSIMSPARLGGGFKKVDRGQFRGPRGVAVDETALYVCDCYNCCIKKFSLADGNFLGLAGGYGEADGQLRYPDGLALSEDGRLFVGDAGNSRISVFTASDLTFQLNFFMHRGATEAGQEFERTVKTLNAFGDGSNRGGYTGGHAGGVTLAVTFQQSIMAKYGSKWASLASPMGRNKRTAALVSEEAPSLSISQPRPSLRPSGMAILDDELFVCDGYSRRLQVFSLDGEFKRYLQPRSARLRSDGIVAENKPLLVRASHSPRGWTAMHRVTALAARTAWFVHASRYITCTNVKPPPCRRLALTTPIALQTERRSNPLALALPTVGCT